MAFTEDPADFINDDTPGYVLAQVAGVDVGGLFDADYVEEFGMSGSRPALVCASADVASATNGTAVVVDSVSYTVAGPPKVSPSDLGIGFTRLMLQEA